VIQIVFLGPRRWQKSSPSLPVHIDRQDSIDLRIYARTVTWTSPISVADAFVSTAENAGNRDGHVQSNSRDTRFGIPSKD
jgi:hypothetical protein